MRQMGCAGKNWQGMWLCALVVPYCQAADINWAASMQSRLQYQDNITLSEANPIADTAGQLWFNSQLWRKTQSQESQLSLALKDDQYAEHSEFEQDLRSLSLDQMIKGELSRYALKAEVSRSTTLGNGYESGEFVRRNLAVNNRVLNASADHQLTEYLSASLSGGATYVRYHYMLNSNNQDYDDRTMSFSLRYQDTASADWQLALYTDRLDQLQSRLAVDTTGATVQRSYKWNELWSLSGKMGRRKTQFAGRTWWGANFTQENYARVSSVDIKRAGENNSWGFGLSEDLSPRINGVIDETQRLGSWWETKPYERAAVKLAISQVKRKPVNTSFFSDDATSYTTLSANLQYSISESLSSDIQLRWIERAITARANRDQAESSTASVGLRWQLYP